MSIRTLLLKRSRTKTSEVDWEAVYKEQLPRVYNYFHYRLNDDALVDDLTAATFERAWRKRHLYRSDLGSFSTWIICIARNLAIDHYRKVEQQESLDTVSGFAAGHTLDDIVERRETIAYLRVLLAQLSEREQDLVALKYGAGYTNRQIALLSGLSETNVGSILHRAIKKLRTQWELE